MFPIAASLPFITISYILILFSLARINVLKNHKAVILFTILVLVVTYLFYEGRYSDWRSYRAFVEACDGFRCTYFEPSYDSLTFLAKRTIGFPLIQLVSLFGFLFSINHLKKILSPSLLLIFSASALVIYLPLYFGALRQSISFSILLVAIVQHLRGNWFSGLLCCLLASSFHFSSAPIYLYGISFVELGKVGIARQRFGMIFVAVIFFLIYGAIWLSYPSIAKFDSFNPGTQAANYDSLKLSIIILERLIMVAISLYVLKRCQIDRITTGLILLTLAGAIFYISMFSFSLNTAGRVTAFFRISDLFVIYLAIKMATSRKRQLRDINRLSDVAIIGILPFMAVKFYFTIYSVGFFR